MGTQSLPRPRRFPKAQAVKQFPERVPLRRVAVVRRFLNDPEERITGEALARLLAGTRTAGRGPALISTAAVAEELACLSDLLQALSTAAHAETAYTPHLSLYWVGECLKRLEHRVSALDGSVDAYTVEVQR